MSQNDAAEARFRARFNLPPGATMQEIEGCRFIGPPEEQCNGAGCQEMVEEGADYYATPCGTYCGECMQAHMKTCEICRNEFQDQ